MSLKGTKKQVSSKTAGATPSGKRARNQDSGEIRGEICVNCKQSVSDDGIECHWCTKWEHRVCAGLNHNEYSLLKIFFQSYVFLLYLPPKGQCSF